MIETKISIRRATKTDLEDLIQLNSGLIDYHVGLDAIYKTSEEVKESEITILENILESQADVIFIAEKDEKSVGFISVVIGIDDFIRPQKVGKLKHFFVEEDFRGQKIGRKLYDTARDYLRKKDVNYLEVAVNAVNTTPISVYKKLGFKDYVLVFNQKI